MRLSVIAAAALLSSASVGCIRGIRGYSVGDRRISDPAVLAQIQSGKSSKAEVRALIGPPANVVFTDSGLEQWLYTYVLAAGFNAQTHTLTILFSEDGIVRNYGSGGSAIAPEQPAHTSQ
jgi:outer membrane protein assembly factor BamE (lipoprotein component of BamABCDE complex)